MHQVSIAGLIPFKLDVAANNFSKWREFFQFVLRKYDASYHVEMELNPLAQSAEWCNEDITVLLWIYNTISDELYEVIRSTTKTAANTAFRAWRLLNSFFHDNQAGRAIHLGAEFRATV